MKLSDTWSVSRGFSSEVGEAAFGELPRPAGLERAAAAVRGPGPSAGAITTDSHSCITSGADSRPTSCVMFLLTRSTRVRISLLANFFSPFSNFKSHQNSI